MSEKKGEREEEEEKGRGGWFSWLSLVLLILSRRGEMNHHCFYESPELRRIFICGGRFWRAVEERKNQSKRSRGRGEPEDNSS